MAQGVLPFKYEGEKKTTGMTALGGLPAYLDLAQVIGLSKSVQKHLKVRTGGQGWTDAQMLLALVLLNLAGGDCVEDIKVLEADIQRGKWEKRKQRGAMGRGVFCTQCDRPQQERSGIQVSGQTRGTGRAAGVARHGATVKPSVSNDAIERQEVQSVWRSHQHGLARRRTDSLVS